MSTSTSTKETSIPGSESSSLLDNTVATPPQRDMRLDKCWDSSRRLQVDLWACLFGISAWLSINALFTQLPLLVQTAPEGWNLPSYLSIIIQLANVGPILYSVTTKAFPSRVRDSKLIYLIMLLGTCSLLLMAFLYDRTWSVFGEPRSGVMFTLTFCLALVGCTSSVLFIPFMNRYPEVYLISYMVGEGLGGLAPSMISLVQGVGGNPPCHNVTEPDGSSKLVPGTPDPLFSTEVFFVIIFSIMAVSTVSFFLLNNLPTCKAQKVRKPPVKEPYSPEMDGSMEPVPIIRPPQGPRTMTVTTYRVFLFLQTVLSMFANGAMPSIQSYSCLPYGNVAYHFAVNLSNMANPVACFITFFRPLSAPFSFLLLCLLTSVSVCYVFVTALMSPYPLLQTSNMGAVLIVVSWTACSGLLSYIKMSVASLFRREGQNGLFWYGAMTQAGAAVGSLVMFYLINHTTLFNSYNPCR